MRSANIQLTDVMPVVVALSARGMYVIDLKRGGDEVLAEFPQDFERFVGALHHTYAKDMPRNWVAQKLRQLLKYLELKDALLVEGDLVRIEDERITGVASMPDVISEASRIYGRDMELFLLILYRLMRDLRRLKQKGGRT